VPLSSDKLRRIVNQLADSGTAHAAAHILAEEAQRRNILVSDLVAQALAPTAPAQAPPAFSDVGAAAGRRINSTIYGPQAAIRYETDKAWLVASPVGGPDVWLPKSQTEYHGDDLLGRAIFVLPNWLARRKGLLS
jgi:hypothetical protein